MSLAKTYGMVMVLGVLICLSFVSSNSKKNTTPELTSTLLPAEYFLYPLPRATWGAYPNNGYGVQNPGLFGGKCFADTSGIRVDWSQLYHGGTDWFYLTDWSAGAGSDVRAIATGEVVYVFPDFYPGGVIIIKHRLPDNQIWYSQYGHVDGILVNDGERVNVGQIIGSVLDQNAITNTHLHSAVRSFSPAGNLALYPVGSAGERGTAYPPYTNCNVDFDRGYTWDDLVAQRHPDYWGYTNPEAFVAAHPPKNYLSFVRKDATPTSTPVPPTPTQTPVPNACEPNETFSTACLLALGMWHEFFISSGDVDWFKFSVPSSYYIDVWLQSIPEWTNYDLELYSPTNVLLAYSRNTGYSNEYINFRALQTGEYRIRVYSSGGYSQTDSYRLQVSVTSQLNNVPAPP